VEAAGPLCQILDVMDQVSLESGQLHTLQLEAAGRELENRYARHTDGVTLRDRARDVGALREQLRAILDMDRNELTSRIQVPFASPHLAMPAEFHEVSLSRRPTRLYTVRASLHRSAPTASPLRCCDPARRSTPLSSRDRDASNSRTLRHFPHPQDVAAVVEAASHDIASVKAPPPPKSPARQNLVRGRQKPIASQSSGFRKSTTVS